MMRKFLNVAMMLFAFFAASAQQAQSLPLDAGVKSGVLPNGLHYYILHNEEPKNRANFYIAQKVGSTLETQEQLGLAHFLEHMAFNGTKNYPGKNMLNYLQTKGIRFGADINAYTAFDETVYNINNVPTSDRPLMDSALLVLHDWSCSILLEEAEIDAERGVIREEWRSRNNAQTRMYTSILPQIYQEYQYQQMPIGSMDVVMNFKPEVLRAYYKKWYRPDQQGIIIVGDFDVAEMEKKVIDLFSTITMPENAAERSYPSVSDNEKPIYASFQDPELNYASILVSFKTDKTPFELRNTDQGFLMDIILPTIISQMINTRLSEYSQKPECPYLFAGVDFSDFFVSKTKDSFNIQIVAKDDLEAAYKSALDIVVRACKAGFTESEVTRARDEILAGYEKRLNEKDKTDSDVRAQQLIRHFIDNKPAPGIETENMLAQGFLSAIPVSAYNEIASSILTPTNQVIVVSTPASVDLISEEVAVADLNNALNAQYEAYQDEVITEPLIAKLPKPGKVKKTETDATLGTTTYTLSNGVKVVIKPTDFAGDEILMTAFAEGGKRSFAESQAVDVEEVGDVFDYSKIGPFDINMLQKYLSGKKVSLGYEIANYTNVFNGRSTVKDLPTLMELIYASFTDVNKDKETFDAMISKARSQLAFAMNNPNYQFSIHLAKARYGNNPMMQPITLETLDLVDYDKSFDILKATTSNAADFTFIFTGNIDPATFLPMVNQYIATLPSTGKKTMVNNLSSVAFQNGVVIDDFNVKAQTPSVTVFDQYTGNNIAFNTENNIYMKMIGEILDMIYIETLREEEGGTYGAAAGGSLNPNTGQWSIAYQFQTNADQQRALRDRAHKELMELLAGDVKEDHFNKVKEAAIKMYENDSRTNKWWNSQLLSYLRGFNSISDYKKTLDGITLPGLKNFMKNLYNGKDRIEVIMNADPENN